MTYAARYRWIASMGLVVLVAALTSGCHGRNTTGKAPQPEGDVATSGDWAGQPVAHAEELMIGRFPGVQVYRAQDGIVIRIRGATSAMGSNEPLFVLDDMPIMPGPGGALVGINPADIESIEVLKDISATSLYGGRGANGVIVIKTKRGR